MVVSVARLHAVSILQQISPAIIAASVAIVVAFLTPAATSLRARRQAIDERFDAALAALLLVRAARQIATGISLAPAGLTPDQHADFNRRMVERSIHYFLDKTADAEAALSEIETFVPEVRDRITNNWELLEEDEPVLSRAVEAGRAKAIKAERLFRSRRPPRPAQARLGQRAGPLARTCS
jgi:hypothetical protein